MNQYLMDWPELNLPERKYVGTLLGIKWFEGPSLPPGTAVMRGPYNTVRIEGLAVSEPDSKHE
jgi:hypothetical protein